MKKIYSQIELAEIYKATTKMLIRETANEGSNIETSELLLLEVLEVFEVFVVLLL